METRNEYLASILTSVGGSITNANNLNSLLFDLVLAVGGVVTDANNRNSLLNDYLNAISGASWYNKTTGMVTCSDTLIECNEELITCL